jgi:ferredoxin
MKARVDPDQCQGHARCWDICPDVFSLDDEGHSFVPISDVPPEHEAAAKDAADNCPERAIILT